MPIYPFRCEAGHQEEFFLRMEKRDTLQKCALCSQPMRRIFAAFGISREHASHTMYGYEQEAWNLATGKNHKTTGEIEDWAKANGKTILNKGEKLKPVDHTPHDREIEKALDKVYTENHSCGELNES